MKKEENLLARLSDSLSRKIQSMDELYAEVGSGKIVISTAFMEALLASSWAPPKRESFLERMVSKVTKKHPPPIVLRSLEDPMISLAKCCSPIKGEPVIGYITAGRGITVHATRCPLIVKEILDGQRLVEAAWGDSFQGAFKAKLLAKSVDSPGVLAKVATLIAQLKGNIAKADVVTFADGKARLGLELGIRDIHHLNEILAGMKQIPEISSVERI